MTPRPAENAEYKALERYVTADKRYRKFLYMATALVMGAFLWQNYTTSKHVDNRVDELIRYANQLSESGRQEDKTIARETTRYITCMFVIPIEKRTPQNQQICFNEADLPGGLTREDFSTFVLEETTDAESFSATTNVAQGEQSGGASSSSSPNPTPNSPTNPLDLSQNPNNDSDNSQPPEPAPSVFRQIMNFLGDLF